MTGRGRPVGSVQPKRPGNESEELAYYKALHHLGQLAKQEDELNDELIALYRKQCEFITLIRPFMSWTGIGDIIGTTAAVVKYRYQTYAQSEDISDVDE